MKEYLYNKQMYKKSVIDRILIIITIFIFFVFILSYASIRNNFTLNYLHHMILAEFPVIVQNYNVILSTELNITNNTLLEDIISYYNSKDILNHQEEMKIYNTSINKTLNYILNLQLISGISLRVNGEPLYNTIQDYQLEKKCVPYYVKNILTNKLYNIKLCIK